MSSRDSQVIQQIASHVQQAVVSNAGPDDRFFVTDKAGEVVEVTDEVRARARLS